MNEKPFVEIPTPLGSEFINPKDIICIRANDKSIILSTQHETEKQVKLSFGKAEKLFSHSYFVKCRRNHIVNVLEINERNKKQSFAKLSNGHSIPVSISCKENLETKLKEFCKKWGVVVNC